MKHIVPLLLSGFLCVASSSCELPTADASGGSSTSVAAGPVEPQPATVTIDVASHRHRLDDRIFGMHIEWVENGLGLLDPGTGRLRTEVVDLLQPLRIPLFRFPGGIHADYYDWRLGVGPAKRRGTSANVFNKETLKHSFGSPEFLALLKATDAEGLITANFGTGTAEDAGAWAAFLRDNGGGVELWEVGNETYLCDPASDQPNGKAIYHSGAAYATAFPAYRKAIRTASPDARVGAIAHLDSGAFPLAPAANRSWTEDMLRRLKGTADFFAVHNAYAPVILDNSVRFDRPDARAAAYRSLFAAAEQTAANLRQVADSVDRLSPANRGAPLAVTEFGPFFGLSADRRTHAQYVDQTRTLASALYTASVLHVLIDDPRVFMACYTNPVHRWFGGLITDTDQGLIATPTYHLYRLFRSRFESQLVETSVTGPTFDAPAIGIVTAHRKVPDLLAQASVSDDGRRLTVMLVNRSLDRALRTAVATPGFAAATADCRVITAPSAAAINGPALSKSTVGGRQISPEPLTCSHGAEIELEIPPAAIVSIVAEKS